MGLPDRVAVYSQNGGSIQDYLFAPKITIERLNELLDPFIRGDNKKLTGKQERANRGIVTLIPRNIPAKDYIAMQKQEDDFIDY